MKYVKSIAAMLMISSAGLITVQAEAQPRAQDTEGTQSLNDLNFLIGEWSLETNYANGAKATGTRICSFALRKTRIRCVTSSLFADKSPRDLEVFYSYSASRKNFAEVTVYQRPVGNKVADLTLDKATGKAVSRGYIYGGDGSSGPRVSEDWSIEDNTISMTLRLNRSIQAAHVWPIFIEEKMTRKK